MLDGGGGEILTRRVKRRKAFFEIIKFGGLAKSHRTVMPDPGSVPGAGLIRHPERTGNTGFRLSPERRKNKKPIEYTVPGIRMLIKNSS